MAEMATSFCQQVLLDTHQLVEEWCQCLKMDMAFSTIYLLLGTFSFITIFDTIMYKWLENCNFSHSIRLNESFVCVCMYLSIVYIVMMHYILDYAQNFPDRSWIKEPVTKFMNCQKNFEYYNLFKLMSQFVNTVVRFYALNCFNRSLLK